MTVDADATSVLPVYNFQLQLRNPESDMDIAEPAEVKAGGKGAAADLDAQPDRVGVQLWDTSGSSTDSLRPLRYTSATIFVVCISLARKTTVAELKKWTAGIRAKNQSAPIVLVGTKSDRRCSDATE